MRNIKSGMTIRAPFLSQAYIMSALVLLTVNFEGGKISAYEVYFLLKQAVSGYLEIKEAGSSTVHVYLKVIPLSANHILCHTIATSKMEVGNPNVNF